MTLSGAKAGSALMLNRATTLMLDRDTKQKSRSAALRKQAEAFTRELSELKGSYVKIGQMLALFGEHLLPEELTDALHGLAHQTTPMCWNELLPVVEASLDGRVGGLDIDPEPLASASLGQVHRATIRDSGEQIVLKVLYPGVRESIDSDFRDVIRLLKLANWLDVSSDLNDWLEEIRSLLHQEVDYVAEADRTEQMRDWLADDEHYVVPRVFREWSSDTVLALEYFEGYEVTHDVVLGMEQGRRTQLAEAMLALFFREIFEWGTLQTDPNFGNYRILPADNEHLVDRLLLLDFGAVRQYDDSFLVPLRQIIIGAHHSSLEEVIEGAIALRCIRASDPEQVQQSFARFCMSLLEPMWESFDEVPGYAINEGGQYKWRESRLMKRVGKQATQSALSRYFMLPPKEFSLVVRKLTGVFSFITVIGGEFNGYPLIHSYAGEEAP